MMAHMYMAWDVGTTLHKADLLSFDQEARKCQDVLRIYLISIIMRMW